jgi:hypothetical protein
MKTLLTNMKKKDLNLPSVPFNLGQVVPNLNQKGKDLLNVSY